ncbi:DUF3597 domain-containing protein [Methylobacterium nodulans]|uniref:DUF3597 domain-containing protein n=1 Tax=Methylobacterium nodulans (strain LMG 21967 / CNCM I-2342 / ORS 2060) TaxID=460265 RepID=B8ITZ1_METNO|nr:DUF3597 domain-containing protein [Methylobacterium nodulans]ACL60849.1 conserved hypothetical protein [Methylobacterium nodulans ORS 2060]
MSLLGTIVSKILHPFGGGEAQAATPEGSSPSATAPESSAPGATGTVPTVDGKVDVEAVLTNLAAKAGQPLNWRTSIVDLMKLLHLDSSLTARKQLAAELHYTGDTDDSATMNIWLHKQVIKKLEENGGKVPDDLKD